MGGTCGCPFISPCIMGDGAMTGAPRLGMSNGPSRRSPRIVFSAGVSGGWIERGCPDGSTAGAGFGTSRRTGLSKETIRRMEAEGKFPKRRKLSTQIVGWFESEVEAWLADPTGWHLDDGTRSSRHRAGAESSGSPDLE